MDPIEQLTGNSPTPGDYERAFRALVEVCRNLAAQSKRYPDSFANHVHPGKLKEIAKILDQTKHLWQD